MKFYWVFVAVILLPIVLGQEDEYDERGLHKRKKKRPHFQQSSPCGYYRDSGLAASEDDGRSVKLVAALGGAALGYHLGTKHGQHQQPVINNIINTNGGGAPCGPVAAAPVYGGGGGGILGGFGGGPFLGSPILGAFGGNRNSGVNWDRTVRQFNRQVIRPVTRWF